MTSEDSMVASENSVIHTNPIQFPSRIKRKTDRFGIMCTGNVPKDVEMLTSEEALEGSTDGQ